jgi:ankyrin repeat protein
VSRAYPRQCEERRQALARESGHENWVALTREIDARSATAASPLESLLRAAGRGDAEEVAAILDTLPNLINQRGSIGESGLRTALHFGVHHEPVVRLLLDRGADPNVRDEGDSAFPIHFAAERGELSIVKLLVERGADPIAAGTDHLLDAVGWAVWQMMDFLSHRTRAIWPLCFHGYVDRVREILREDPSLARQLDREGCTPLWWLPDDEVRAAEIVELLLAAGADPAHRNKDGHTAADWARRRGMTEIAVRLDAAAM